MVKLVRTGEKTIMLSRRGLAARSKTATIRLRMLELRRKIYPMMVKVVQAGCRLANQRKTERRNLIPKFQSLKPSPST